MIFMKILFKNLNSFKFCLKKKNMKKDKNILKNIFWEYKIFLTFFLS